jgi:hypothetical protein
LFNLACQNYNIYIAKKQIITFELVEKVDNLQIIHLKRLIASS